jgi:hypothetical protein
MRRICIIVAVATIGVTATVGAAQAAPTWLTRGQMQAALLTADEVNAAVPQSLPVAAGKDSFSPRRQKATTFPFHWTKFTVAQGYVREFTAVDGAVPLTTVPVAVEFYETASPAAARKWLAALGTAPNPTPNITNEVKNGVFIVVMDAGSFFAVNVGTRVGRSFVGATCNGKERAATIACATAVMNAQKTKLR